MCAGYSFLSYHSTLFSSLVCVVFRHGAAASFDGAERSPGFIPLKVKRIPLLSVIFLTVLSCLSYMWFAS